MNSTVNKFNSAIAPNKFQRYSALLSTDVQKDEKFVKKTFVPKRNYNGTKDENQLIRGSAVQQRSAALPEVSEESSHIVRNHINHHKTRPAY